MFLTSAMHHDLGDVFAVGDTMSWNVVLIDGRATVWPEHALADVMVTIRPRARWALHGAIADTGGIQACWRGPEPPGTPLALSAGLAADVWNPPFPAGITGMLRRIRTVAYARREHDDVLPSGPWVLQDIERTPRWIRTAKPDDALSLVREDGLLITSRSQPARSFRGTDRVQARGCLSECRTREVNSLAPVSVGLIAARPRGSSGRGGWCVGGTSSRSARPHGRWSRQPVASAEPRVAE